MTTLRTCLLASTLLIPSVVSAQSSELRIHGECQGSAISVTWTMYRDPGGYPVFVGYDIYRQTLPECGTPIRLNAEPFPRIPGQTHSHTFEDPSPAPATMYRYDLLLVDANRQAIPHPPEFCDPCYTYAWESCPSLSAPLVQGTVTDRGLWLELIPCQGSCYGVPCYPGYCSFLLGSWPPELEQYVDTGIPIRVFGNYQCELTEGCFIDVRAFDVQACGVVPAEPATWGRIKAAYE